MAASRNASEVAKKTFAGMEGAEVLAAAVETLNPPASGGQDWVLSDFSPDAVVETALFGLAKNLGLATGNSDIQQTLITTLSYVALAEFAQQVLGLGSGFASMDFQGIAIAQINQKLDLLIKNVGALLREPLESAKEFFEQALLHFGNGDLEQCIKRLEEVNKNATKALSLLNSTGNEDTKLDDLLCTTRLLIFADIVPATIATTDKGKVFTPPTKQTMDQRMKVSNLVAHHLQKLVESVDKMKPGRIKKFLTLNKQQKKEEKQDKLDQLMKTTIPLLVPTITVINKKTRKIQLPPTKFFPDGEEDKTYLIIDQPDGSKGKLWLWTELKNKKLVLEYCGWRYVTSLQDSHTITIKEGRIVDMEETKDLMLTEFTNKEGHNWSPSELSLVSEGVSA